MEVQHRRSWLAAYTRSRHEHHVADQLRVKSLEFLLPTYEKHARWSDRIKRSQAPLFPGYVFVHISDSERVPVLQTLGVVNLVSTGGRASVLREEEVERLRACQPAVERYRAAPLSKNWTPGAGETRPFRWMGRHAAGKVQCPPIDYHCRPDHEVRGHQPSWRGC